MKKLSVIIPVYNSEGTISEVIDRTIETLSRLNSVDDYEIILVNDGSRDGSSEICRKRALANNKIKFLNFSTNFGQHKALIAGYRHVTGDCVVKLDDDLQMAPEDIEKLLDAMMNMNLDVVYADYESKEHSLMRNLGSMVNSKMACYFIGKPNDITMSSFYIMRRFVVDEIAKYDGNFPYTPGIIFKVTRSIGNVPVTHYPRLVGTSNYTLGKLVSLWFNGFTNFSVKPLRMASVIGSILALLSFIITTVIVIRKLLVPGLQVGWTSIMVSILFLGSIQLLSIGLLGEYVGRTFLCINKIPQYVVKESYNLDQGENSDYRG